MGESRNVTAADTLMDLARNLLPPNLIQVRRRAKAFIWSEGVSSAANISRADEGCLIIPSFLWVTADEVLGAFHTSLVAVVALTTDAGAFMRGAPGTGVPIDLKS